MKKHIKRGFSLAELGIALVILLIVSTIAVISYFSIIDNAKEVKVVEEAKTIRLSLARQGIDIKDYSTPVVYDDLDPKVKEVLEYHLSNGTNLVGTVFQNKAILKDGEYIIGELRAKTSDLDSTVLLDLLNIDKVKASDVLDDICVRQLDSNEMSKVFTEDFKGDWYIVESLGDCSTITEGEEIKGPIIISSNEPYDYNNGLLDDPNIILNLTDIPSGMFDNNLLTNYNPKEYFEHIVIDLKYPVSIKSFYVSEINTYLTVSFYDETGNRTNINDSLRPSYRLYTALDNIVVGYNPVEVENVHSIVIHTASTNLSNKRSIREIDFFGSYIVEDVK